MSKSLSGYSAPFGRDVTGQDLLDSSIERLFRHHRSWLIARIVRRLGCRETASDLAHDTFLRLISIQHRETVRAPKALLGTIADGLVVDLVRRREIERLFLAQLADLPDHAAPSSEDLVMIVDVLHRVSAALDTLKPRARAVFLLSRMDDLPYPEIARRLGVSLSTVEKDMASALVRCYRVWHGA
ncbi:MAG: sigma-70 family RNA polymerase sigma factor [Pseudomonadota bacterium]